MFCYIKVAFWGDDVGRAGNKRAGSAAVVFARSGARWERDGA